MWIRSRSLAMHILCPFALLGACGDSGRGAQPTVPDRQLVEEHRMTPEQVRQLTGVDRLPEAIDKAAFKASIERHYPAELLPDGTSGSALVDVLVDAGGRVASATPIDRPAGMHAVMILEQKDGTQRRITPNDHPAFQAAAASALREVRFSPAIRDGQPVPFTLRMTVTFDPPARRE
jgi:outer membrane biosynthesis protein TonB